MNGQSETNLEPQRGKHRGKEEQCVCKSSLHDCFCLVTGFIFIMAGVVLIYVQSNLIPVVLAILLGFSMLYLGIVKFLERRGQKAFENKDSQD